MTFSKSTLRAASAGLIIACCYAYVCVLVPLAPDASVFLYGGMRLLDGMIPYVDFWDHKGPLIYIFNYLGLLLFDHKSGPWVLEGFLVATSISGCAILWVRKVDWSVSLLISVALVASYLALFEYGNLTETWLFSFQLIAYTLAFDLLLERKNATDRFQYLTFFVLGLACGIALLTKLTNSIGIITLGAYLLKQSIPSQRGIMFLWMFFGVAILFLPTILWVSLNGALTALVEQYIEFNFSYVTGSAKAHLINHIRGIRDLVLYLITSPLAIFNLYVAFKGFGSKASFESSPLSFSNALSIFSLILLIDVSCQFISGRPYQHYLVVCLPALSICALILSKAVDLEVVSSGKEVVWVSLRSPLMVLVMFVLAIRTLGPLYSIDAHTVSENKQKREQLLKLKELAPQKSDLISVLGNETWLLVAANRRSASRLVFLYPGISPGTAKVEKSAEINNPDVSVVLMRYCSEVLFCPFPERSLLMPIVEANYSLSTRIGTLEFWARNREPSEDNRFETPHEP